MGVKRYQILIELAYRDAAAKKAAADLGTVEKAARKSADAQQKAIDDTAKAAEKAAGRQVKAAEKAAKDVQAASDRVNAALARDADRLATREEAALRRAAREAEKAAAQKARAYKKALTDEEVALAVHNAKVARANQARVDQAVRAAGAFGESTTMAERLGTAVSGLAGPFAALAGAKGIVEGVGAAFSAANQAAEAMGRQVLDTLDDLREIAAIKGKFAPDEDELAQYTDLRKGSGLKHNEAVAYTGQLYNALGTVSEARFDAAERKKLDAGGAKLAARMGGGEEGATARASMLGLLPGFLQDKDAQGRPRKITADEVLATADRGEEILSRGAASNSAMAQQAQKVMTAIASPEMKGTFKNPLKADALTAIASKFETEGFGTAALEFAREMRGMTKFRKAKGMDHTQAEFLARAGVDEADDADKAARKVFKLIDKETNGGKDRAIDQYLREQGFNDEIGPRRISQFYEQHRTGLYEDVMGMADVPVDLASPEKKFAAFAASDVGRDRLNQAAVDAAKIDRGKLRTPLVLARDQARAEIIKEGKTDNALADIPTKIGLGVAGMIPGINKAVPEYEDFAAERRVMEKRGFGNRGVSNFLPLAGAADPASMMLGLTQAIVGPVVKDIAGSLTGHNAELVRALDANTKATQASVRAAQPPANVPPPPRQGRP